MKTVSEVLQLSKHWRLEHLRKKIASPTLNQLPELPVPFITPHAATRKRGPQSLCLSVSTAVWGLRKPGPPLLCWCPELPCQGQRLAYRRCSQRGVVVTLVQLTCRVFLDRKPTQRLFRGASSRMLSPPAAGALCRAGG